MILALVIALLILSCCAFVFAVVVVICTVVKDKRIEDAHQRQRESENARIMAIVEFRAGIAAGEIEEGVHFLPGVGFVEVKSGKDEARDI